MGNRSVWGELGDEGLAEDELLAEVRALLGGLNPAPELSLSETESARVDHVLSRLLIDTTSAPPDDPRRREGPGPSHRSRWPLAPSSKKRAAIALGVAACAAALVATVAVVALQGDRNPASAQPALPRPLTFANGGHAAAVSLLERAAALQVSLPSGPGGRSRYAKTQNYAVNVNVGRTHNTTTTFVVTTVQQVWVAPGCKALEKSYSQATSATTGADIGGPGPESTDEHWVDTNCGFPTSASAVVARLVGADGSDMDRQDRDYALADGAMAQLGLGTATPRQVAALYRVLESLPRGLLRRDRNRRRRQAGPSRRRAVGPGEHASDAGAEELVRASWLRGCQGRCRLGLLCFEPEDGPAARGGRGGLNATVRLAPAAGAFCWAVQRGPGLRSG